jgi:hypothetical protein
MPTHTLTVTARLKGGAVDGWTVQVPLPVIGGRPVRDLELVIVDDAPHVVGVAPDAVMSRAPRRGLVYHLESGPLDGEPVYVAHIDPK